MQRIINHNLLNKYYNYININTLTIKHLNVIYIILQLNQT